MKNKILISPSSFGKCSDEPIKILKNKDYDIIINPYGRKLTENEVIKLGKECVGIIAGVEPLNQSVLSSLENLNCISRVGVGLDNIDLEYAKEKGIIVKNTPCGPTQAVAELTVGLIIDLIRKITLRDRRMREGIWYKQMGFLMMNKKIGIIGLGRIGKNTVNLLKNFNVNIFAYDIKPDKKWAADNKVKLIGFEDLLKKADIIILHIPPSKNNKPIIGKKEIQMIKKQSYLINVSRGGVVDEDALFSALKKKDIAGAAVDVFLKEPYKGPLLKLDNVVLTPHIGTYAKEARINMELQSVNNLLEVIEK